MTPAVPVVSRTDLLVGDHRLSVSMATPAGSAATDSELRPPVLAVHGFGSDAEHTWGSTGHLRALTVAGRTVIAPDLLGHGRSDKPHDPAAYSLSGLVDDLAAVVDRLGVAEVDVIGYSLGARLAIALAGPGLDSAAPTSRAVAVRRLVLGGYDARQLFDGISEATFRLALADPDALAGADEQTRRIARIAFALPHNDLVALAAVVRALPATQAAPLEEAGLPTVPTLVVAGDADPLAAGAHRLADALPAGEFLGIAGRDHVSTLTSGVFRRSVVEFLDRRAAA